METFERRCKKMWTFMETFERQWEELHVLNLFNWTFYVSFLSDCKYLVDS